MHATWPIDALDAVKKSGATRLSPTLSTATREIGFCSCLDHATDPGERCIDLSKPVDFAQIGTYSSLLDLGKHRCQNKVLQMFMS